MHTGDSQYEAGAFCGRIAVILGKIHAQRIKHSMVTYPYAQRATKTCTLMRNASQTAIHLRLVHHCTGNMADMA